MWDSFKGTLVQWTISNGEILNDFKKKNDRINFVLEKDGIFSIIEDGSKGQDCC